MLIDARDEFFHILENSLTGETPILRIINSCNSVMELMQQTNFVGGCLFGNTALEMTDSNPRFGEIIQEIFTHWTTRIEQQVLQATDTGEFKSEIPSHSLATAIVSMLEGGIMFSRVYGNKKGLEDCILAIRSFLKCRR
ncbi:TetR family transcriptional regulator C-terminal domain-containing protein [Desulfocapsa sulfexigens]|uniref:TetR family transcriptional regulator C-terminal domain-containing protein n=1 Tax=Desulfocapsa sulfexigens TaxID=65555 RepID=UPI001D17896E|nr:TetR family transcriptional regulator C-terminal domain-containing protein [Desulfocapsa sulfexigens]